MRAILIVFAITTTVAALTPHHTNPCIAQCTTNPGSAECATCCRTARHKVSWNCPVPTGSHGDHNPRDTHNGRAAACCNGDWNAACWDEPSDFNYNHACNMCASANNFIPTNGGCDGQWSTAACWSYAKVPSISQADSEEPANYVECSDDVIPIMGNYHATVWNLEVGARCTIEIEAGSTLTAMYFASNAADGEPVPILRLLGTAGQLQLNVSGDVTTVSPVQIEMGAQEVRLFNVGPNNGLKLRFVPLPPNHVNRNTGLVPAKVYLSDANYLSVANDMIYIDARFGALSFILVGQRMPFPNIFMNCSSDILPNTLSITGLVTFPPSKMLTVADIVYPTGTKVSLSSGVIFQGTATATGTGAIRFEALTGTTVTAGAAANLLAAGPSELVVDGGVASPSATSTQDALIVCSGCEVEGFGPCIAPGCAGVCTGQCTCITNSTFHSVSNGGGCTAGELCTSPCLGGAMCAGANSCTTSCPATTTAHFTANCLTQDGTCAAPCLAGTMCGAGDVCTGTCPATATAHYNAACTSQDGTCATPCIGGATCAVGGTCNTGCAATATAHYAANCTAQDAACAPACPFGMCAVSTTGTAGRCLCPAISTTAFYSADCRTTATCATACVGGALCAGTNTCGTNCPATRTAHFNAACNAQDGTCATACPYGWCQAGNTCSCPASNSTVGYAADCRSIHFCAACLGGATCTGSGVCTGCTSTESTTYSTECTQVCAAGYSGSNCGTYTSVAPAVTTGSGRIVFTFGAGNLTSIGTISAFIASVRSAVATSAGVAESRVSVAALTPAAGGAPGYTVTVDIAAGAASDPTVAAALASVGSNPPAAFGSVPVPAGAASCAGFSSCAEANTPAGGGESKKPRISDGAAIGIALAGLIAVIVVVSLIWYFCARDAPVFENKNDAARGRGQSAVEIH